MDQKNGVFLKPGKEKAIINHHHWIFSGAVQSLPNFKSGDLLPVFSSKGELVGTGYFNRASGIIGRMVSFDATPPLEKIAQRLKSALELRRQLFDHSQTNAYRLVNGEGDGIPGLIIDRYGDVIVLQSSTKGIDCLKPWLVDWLVQNISPQTIYEKSLLPSRREEKLEDSQGYLFGKEEDQITFIENGIQFSASLKNSQKTGFFLDHREMRQWVRGLVKNKKVLNAFSYTGGFTLYALAGGASRVDSVDISKEAIEAAKQNISLNGYPLETNHFFAEDVFEFLREKDLSYDFVILDPPAFAKKQRDVIAACRGYKDINRLAFQKMPPQSMLLTCSCSYHVNEELFQQVIFQAALEAKREVRIIGKHRLGGDHPVNIYHPESQYLKSFLLYVE